MNTLTQIKNIQKISAQEAAKGVSDSASWHARFKDSAYIHVGGLPYDLTEGDILAVFSQYGEIVDVNLVRDKGTGKSRGFAFMAYLDQRSTVVAVDNLNGAKVAGRIVKVDHVGEYKRYAEETEEEKAERQRGREEAGVCRKFQLGECTRGDLCKFSHDERRAADTGWGPSEDRGAEFGGRNGGGRKPDPVEHNGRDERAAAGGGAREKQANRAVVAAAEKADGGAGATGGGGGGGGAMPWEGSIFSMLSGALIEKTKVKERKKGKEKMAGETLADRHGRAERESGGMREDRDRDDGDRRREKTRERGSDIDREGRGDGKHNEERKRRKGDRRERDVGQGMESGDPQDGENDEDARHRSGVVARGMDEGSGEIGGERGQVRSKDERGAKETHGDGPGFRPDERQEEDRGYGGRESRGFQVSHSGRRRNEVSERRLGRGGGEADWTRDERDDGRKEKRREGSMHSQRHTQEGVVRDRDGKNRRE